MRADQKRLDLLNAEIAHRFWETWHWITLKIATTTRPVHEPAGVTPTPACIWCVKGFIAQTGVVCRTCHGTGVRLGG